MTISLIIADTAGVVAGILEGALEFGVVGAESRDRNILQEKLTDDQMRLIVPAGHPWAAKKKIPLAALLAEPFIARERGSGTLKSIQDSLARIGRSAGELTVVAEMGSTEAIRQAIKNHVGVSILSSLAVAEEIRSGTLRALTVEGLDLTRSFFLVHHRQRSLSPLGLAFIELLKAHLKVLSSPAPPPT
jgi:DNA-binding transcriptional LysR family regulator